MNEERDEPGQLHPAAAPLAGAGRLALGLVGELGGLAVFVAKALGQMFLPPPEVRKIVHQVYVIGVRSVPVIVLVGLFTGMVLGLQGYYTLVKFGSEGLLGAAVALTLIRELGPVLTAIMVVGQAGSAMAAEIGIQRNGEQIDYLQTAGIDPLRFLVGPRLVAALLVFPLLTAVFDVVGIGGGYLTGVLLLGVDAGVYWHRIEYNVGAVDVLGGFYKAFAFGLLTVAICCYQGFFTHLRAGGFGAAGVSRSATSAVVLSAVSVLVVDYVLTTFLL